MVPVPDWWRLVGMSDFPIGTDSEALNFRGSAGRAKARRAKAEAWRESAPAAQAVPWRNSRRFMGPPCGRRFKRQFTSLMDARNGHRFTSRVATAIPASLLDNLPMGDVYMSNV